MVAKERLKDLLQNVKPGDYEKIMGYIVTPDDIKDFHELYNEFETMKTSYLNMIYGRKEIAKELTKKLTLLKQMSELIYRGITIQKDHYESATRDLEKANINELNYDKVFEVLKKLASNEDIQYDIKKVTYPTVESSDRYGYRTKEKYTSELTILGEKGIISQINDSLPCLKHNMLESIYHQGYSMILVGDAYYTEHLNLPNKKVIGCYHPFVLYLQDDALAKAAISFIDFIKENGTDLDNIEVDDLVNVLKQQSKTIKKL